MPEKNKEKIMVARLVVDLFSQNPINPRLKAI